MSESRKAYEPPRIKVFQFENNDQILTASGDIPTPDPTQPPNYAANALNEFMGGTNTTIE